MCDFKSKCATTPCHAEEADRLTKHLLPINAVEAADSSTPLRSAQNDRANWPLILKSHMTLPENTNGSTKQQFQIKQGIGELFFGDGIGHHATD